MIVSVCTGSYFNGYSYFSFKCRLDLYTLLFKWGGWRGIGFVELVVQKLCVTCISDQWKQKNHRSIIWRTLFMMIMISFLIATIIVLLFLQQFLLLYFTFYIFCVKLLLFIYTQVLYNWPSWVLMVVTRIVIVCCYTILTLNIGTILSSYHTCPMIFKSLFHYLLMCLKYCCMYGKQCKPWWDATFCSIWSGSTLFEKACLSQYLGLLW